MFKYEVKKVFSKNSSKIAMVLLLLLIGVTCWFAMDVYFVNERGEKETGYRAVRQLREAQKKWTGILDEKKLQSVIKENASINHTPEARSANITENDIAYGWKQGISEIRKLLNCSYAEEFRSYDYYRADGLVPKDAASFYENRTTLLKNWLSGEAKNQFSDTEKRYLIQQYENLDTPFFYDYMKGWTQAMEYAPTIIMITIFILSFLVSGIFSNEFSWKTDAVFFTTEYGRNKATAAKIKAGISIVTILYWTTILLYSQIVLFYLGTDGGTAPVQADSSGWKCFYHITIWQKYLLTIVGGYIGCLFIALLTMLISAKTNSSVLAVMTPFVLVFVPSFLDNIKSDIVRRTLGLLPDRMLQVNMALNYFDLYDLGDKVNGAIPILFVLYGLLTMLLIPVTYQAYRHRQVL